MRIFLPALLYERITDVTPRDLLSHNIRAIALDVDNTLAHPHCPKPLDGALNWVAAMKTAGIRMIIVSNARKKRVEPFAKQFGLDYISAAFKPFPFCFFKVKKRLGVKRRELAIIGDQVFTDIIAGNLFGLAAILVMPAKPENALIYRIKRRLEFRVIKKYNKKNQKKGR